ncbi:hypothetical protein ACGF5C_31525 [Micromonospora sp. NPDC047620]|uniref:hypothetical protein n=1 Tax=Micromonospora sp. NPDC047620 TaxID=3364251 RepID=UPI00371E14BF
MAREKVEFDVVGRDSGGSKVFKQVGDAAEKAGDQVEGLGEQFSHLDTDIAAAQAAVRDLAAEIDRTGNKELFKDLRKQQGELRKLMSARNLLPDPDDGRNEALRFGARVAEGVAAGLSKAGGPIAAAFSNVFGTLPPQAQAAIGAGVVGAATAAGPLIGGVISAAVVGAAGGGGIIGGVAIAARNPAVQAAAKETGSAFSDALEQAAESFVPATIESLGVVRSRIGDISDDLDRAGNAASRMLRPLTEDVLDGAESAVEGFATAVERSGPVVAALGTIAERAGDLVGDTFTMLSENSAEASRALGTLWTVFEYGTRGMVATIAGLTEVYGWMEKLSAVATGDAARLAELVAQEEAAKNAGGGMSEGLQNLINALAGTGDAAGSANADVETFQQTLERFRDAALGAENAEIRMEEAIDRAAEAAQRGKRGIDTNTEAGRANRRALLNLAEATKASSAAILESTGSHDLAAQATERGRAKFLAAAKAMGVEKGEAVDLANSLFGIPEKRQSDVDVNIRQTPIDLKTVAGRIAAIKSKRVVITVVNNQVTTRSEGRNVGIGDGVGGRASGGSTLRGETYWVGERGPELLTFADNGYVLNARQSADIARSTMLAGSPAPAGVAAGPGVDDLFRAFVRALQTVPVARIDSGRTADIYARAG